MTIIYRATHVACNEPACGVSAPLPTPLASPLPEGWTHDFTWNNELATYERQHYCPQHDPWREPDA